MPVARRCRGFVLGSIVLWSLGGACGDRAPAAGGANPRDGGRAGAGGGSGAAGGGGAGLAGPPCATASCSDGGPPADGNAKETAPPWLDAKASLPPETCPPGTEAIGSLCGDLHPGVYTVTVAVTQIPADGVTLIPVLISGRTADGGPSHADVVLSTDRIGAGDFTPSATVRLGGPAHNLFFVPCSDKAAGCLGSFEISLALASDPASPVARTGPLTLSKPTGVGSPAACLGANGNVLFLAGNDNVERGIAIVEGGTWKATLTGGTTIEVVVDSYEWELTLSSAQLGAPLTERVYDMAERYPFERGGHPGLDLSGHGFGCNTLSGRFQIERLSVAGTALEELTATFEQYCDSALPSYAVTRGCLHYQR